MFDLIEQPVNEPELSMREKSALEEVQRWKDKMIDGAVAIRMLDPEFVIGAIRICLQDCLATQTRMADLLMGHGDQSISLANIRMDVKSCIHDQAKKEAERGML